MSINWGIIGAGGIADRRTVPEMLEVAKNSRLVAVMDTSTESVQRVAKKYDVAHAYTNEEELLKLKEVDAVYIATPQHLHYKQVLLAAEYGKHILCEKPMAISLAQAEEMIEVCKKAGVKFGIMYNMRLNVYNQRAKEIIDQGLLGQLVMGRAQLTSWYPPIPGAWRQDISLSYGGALIDMGTHCIDMLEYLMGLMAVEVVGFQGSITHEYKTEDTSTILLRFENGAHGIVDNYWNIEDGTAQNFLEIYGTKGSILAEGTIGQNPTGKMTSYLIEKERGYDAQQARDKEVGVRVESYHLKPQPTYGTLVNLFADAIENDKEPFVTAEEGYRNLKVVLAAYEAARTGKVVRIE
jgi:predicted dehydrogenase